MSGVRLGSCALVEPSRSLTEEYGVVVGHTLVDASSRSASVLIINPNAEEVVLLSFTCVGLRTEQTCVQEMLLGGQIEPSDSL